VSTLPRLNAKEWRSVRFFIAGRGFLRGSDEGSFARQELFTGQAAQRGCCGRQTTAPRSEDAVNRSLVNTSSEELYRGKAMYVWWMLRDMIGEPALKKAFAAYHP